MGMIMTGAYNPLPVAPIALVGASVDGKPNYLAVGFVNGVNIKPPIIYVSLNKKHHTPRGIIENGTFSINVPAADHVVETDYCGLVSGRDVDKSTIFTTFYGELKTAPMIAEFPITCECRYTGQKVEFEMDTVYFGEVIQVYVNEEVLDKSGKIDIQKVNPCFYSGLENRYRSSGEDLGPGWSIGRQYKPKMRIVDPATTGSEIKCEIVERAPQPALSIRERISPGALTAAIGQSASAIFQLAMQRGCAPTGALFVAYHGFDGQILDVEIGFPFERRMEGGENIRASMIPGGKAAVYRHMGPYEKLPEIRAVLEHWLIANGYAPSGMSYEMYLNDPRTTAGEDLETEILFPLVSEN